MKGAIPDHKGVVVDAVGGAISSGGVKGDDAVDGGCVIKDVVKYAGAGYAIEKNGCRRIPTVIKVVVVKIDVGTGTPCVGRSAPIKNTVAMRTLPVATPSTSKIFVISMK